MPRASASQAFGLDLWYLWQEGMKTSVDKRGPVSWIHQSFCKCKMSRHQKQGYVWFLPWWHVLAFSFFYHQTCHRFFLDLCVVPNSVEHFCAKSSNFSNWKATILLYMLVQCLWGLCNWYGTESDRSYSLWMCRKNILRYIRDDAWTLC